MEGTFQSQAILTAESSILAKFANLNADQEVNWPELSLTQDLTSLRE
ncbi:hypothetical protein CCACVL1_30538 [Corchorus capsularis]|uniref:Uncharacterized protein n=1 Tax=Corchorus capsularis TaxID=210143 RepID=A0A1R3FWR3_COCAP|nr:hypothetical protein CCACVL1_30538 [Corchorus capsularis]